MPVIVFINDWKGGDYYRAMLEGWLFSFNPEIQLRFINTHVRLYDVYEAGLILRSCFFNFPEETIFVIGVKSVVPEELGYVYARVQNRHIFCANNGILTFVMDEHSEELYALPYVETTFAEKDIFLPAIVHLLEKKEMSEITEPVSSVMKMNNLYPSFSKNILIGMVIYNDVYGNAVTNISRNYFEKCAADRNYVIYPGTRHEHISHIYNYYPVLEAAQLFAVFNTLNLLELGIYENDISSLFNLKPRTNITIEFI